MTLNDGWLWLFLGLMAVGFFMLLFRFIETTRAKKPTSTKTLFDKRKEIREWERLFAWKPVRTIDKGNIWLRYYWRRQIYSPATVGGLFEETYSYQNVVQIAWYTW